MREILKNVKEKLISKYSKSNNPKEVFEFCNSWKGKIPIVVVPTSYGNVTIDELTENNLSLIHI